MTHDERNTMRKGKTLIGFALGALMCAGAFSGVKMTSVAHADASPVCKIGDTTYTTLFGAAQDVQDSQTITMLSDWDQNNESIPVWKTNSLSLGKTFTLDLGDYKLTPNNTINIYGHVTINANDGGIDTSRLDGKPAVNVSFEITDGAEDPSKPAEVTISGGTYGAASSKALFDVSFEVYESGNKSVNSLAYEGDDVFASRVHIGEGTFYVEDAINARTIDYIGINKDVIASGFTDVVGGIKVTRTAPFADNGTKARLSFDYNRHSVDAYWRAIQNTNSIVEGKIYCIARVNKSTSSNIMICNNKKTSNGYSMGATYYSGIKDNFYSKYSHNYETGTSIDEHINKACPFEALEDAKSFRGPINPLTDGFVLAKQGEYFNVASVCDLTEDEIATLEKTPSILHQTDNEIFRKLNWLYATGSDLTMTTHNYTEYGENLKLDSNYGLNEYTFNIYNGAHRISSSKNASASLRYSSGCSVAAFYSTGTGSDALYLYEYVGEHEETDFTNVGMSFGNTITAAEYNMFNRSSNDLIGEDAEFGIMAQKNSTLNGQELTAATALSNAGRNIQPARVSDVAGCIADPSGDYYHFALKLTGFTTGRFNIEFTARAYMLLNGHYYYAAPKTYSINSLAKAYVDAQDTSSYAAYIDYLTELSTAK